MSILDQELTMIHITNENAIIQTEIVQLPDDHKVWRKAVGGDVAMMTLCMNGELKWYVLMDEEAIVKGAAPTLLVDQCTLHGNLLIAKAWNEGEITSFPLEEAEEIKRLFDQFIFSVEQSSEHMKGGRVMSNSQAEYCVTCGTAMTKEDEHHLFCHECEEI